MGLLNYRAAFALLAFYTAACMAETLPADNSKAGLIVHAGPVQAELVDGQLRYIRVGDQEIVRRIYFGVREPNWDTDMPVFSEMKVDPADDHFTVKLAAHCQGKAARFDYQATIAGAANGTIIYSVEGEAPDNVLSNRIGLCVLYGTQSAVGQEFLLADTGAGPKDGLFPLHVSPTLVAKNFKALQYTTPSGVKVSCGISESPFEMEDQRNWGDTSFKAYNPMPYAYPIVKKGERMRQTLQLTVEDVPAEPAALKTLEVTLGDVLPKKQIPAIVPAADLKKAISFTELNQKLKQYQDQDMGTITWTWTTATHLPDEETQMENLPGIADQAETVRTVAPLADLQVASITMQPGSGNVTRPPGFTSAWTAAAIKWLAMGGVATAGFDKLGPENEAMVSDFKAYAGKPLLEAKLSRQSEKVEAFGSYSDSGRILFLVNKDRVPVLVALPAGVEGEPKRLGSAEGEAPKVVRGAIKLGPYDVVQIPMRK